MTFRFTSGFPGLQPLTETSSTQNHEIGLKATGFDSVLGTGEYIYLKGVASTVVGDLVVFDEYANTTTRAVSGSRGPVAVAMSANVANQYGWYQICGAAKVLALAAAAANATAYLTATAGSIDDAVVTAQAVNGLRIKTNVDTPTTGMCVCQLAYPSADGLG